MRPALIEDLGEDLRRALATNPSEDEVLDQLEGQREGAENHRIPYRRDDQWAVAKPLAEAKGFSGEDDLGQRQRLEEGQPVNGEIDLVLVEDQTSVRSEDDEKGSQVEENHHELAKLVKDLLFPATFFRMGVGHRVLPWKGKRHSGLGRERAPAGGRPLGTRLTGLDGS